MTIETELTLDEEELKQAIVEYLDRKGYVVLPSIFQNLHPDKKDYDIDISVDDTGDQRDPGRGAYATVGVKHKC